MTTYQIVNDILRLVIPATCIVIGWLVVSNQQDKRERRKEIRDLVEEVTKIILIVREDVLEYFGEKNNDPTGPLADKIKLNLLLISQYLFLMKSAGLNIKVSQELIALRKTATGGFFETVDFKKQLENPQWLGNLRSESVELILAIQKAYFRQFKVKP